MQHLSWNQWENTSILNSYVYDCGWCFRNVASTHGYFNANGEIRRIVNIYICPNCGLPTINEGEWQYPGPLLGRSMQKLPADVEAVYKEMREACKHSLATATVLLGRKLIMHLAVDVAGAAPNQSFVQHIEHLKQANFIPPKSEQWLNLMRNLGNETTHEIKMASMDDAKRIITFVEILLTFMYEYADDPNST